MNYLEEQRNEIEALRWIYPEELTVLEEEPFYSIAVRVSTEGSKSDSVASCNLRFTFTAKYPEEIPEMEFEADDSIDESDAEQLKQFMQDQATSSLGMAMVYTIVSAVQEKLLCLVDEAVQRKALEKERLEKEREEAERKRFEGTLVTVETFIAWKEKFDAELARKKGAKIADGPRRLTGRELFLRDHTLDDSDLRFVEAEGDALPVDESLFENLEDLDLGDDDSEDGDYVPGASDSDEDDDDD